MRNRRRSVTRSQAGNLMAEMPAGLYVLFFGIAMPMLIMATMATRAFLCYQATIDSCKQASRQSTFTLARNKALAVFAASSAAWTGISGTPTFAIIRKPLGAGPNKVYGAPLPTGDISSSSYVYLARVVVVGQIDPLFPIGYNYAGMSIPGLTTGYPLTMTYVFFFENPSGLST